MNQKFITNVKHFDFFVNLGSSDKVTHLTERTYLSRVAPKDCKEDTPIRSESHLCANVLHLYKGHILYVNF